MFDTLVISTLKYKKMEISKIPRKNVAVINFVSHSHLAKGTDGR